MVGQPDERDKTGPDILYHKKILQGMEDEMIIENVGYGAGAAILSSIAAFFGISKLFVSKDTCKICGDNTRASLAALWAETKDQTKLLHEIKGKLESK